MLNRYGKLRVFDRELVICPTVKEVSLEHNIDTFLGARSEDEVRGYRRTSKDDMAVDRFYGHFTLCFFSYLLATGSTSKYKDKTPLEISAELIESFCGWSGGIILEDARMHMEEKEMNHAIKLTESVWLKFCSRWRIGSDEKLRQPIPSSLNQPLCLHDISDQNIPFILEYALALKALHSSLPYRGIHYLYSGAYDPIYRDIQVLAQFMTELECPSERKHRLDRLVNRHMRFWSI